MAAIKLDKRKRIFLIVMNGENGNPLKTSKKRLKNYLDPGGKRTCFPGWKTIS